MKNNGDIIIQQSLLHRLSQNEENTWTNLQQAKLLIKEDLEKLLNSRPSTPQEHSFKQESNILNYGLPHIGYIHAHGIEKLQAAIKQTIERFEPRIKEVDISILPSHQYHDLNIMIKATLCMRESRSNISYQCQLNFSNKYFTLG